jgi:putative membrane protein
MKNYLFYLLFAAGATLATGCGNSSDSTSVDAAGKHNEELLESTGKDEKAGWFVAKAASAGLFEVELGRLASSKAVDPRVKKYGQMMLDHHTQTNAQLKQTADLKNLMVPTTLSDDHQEIYNEIMSKSGVAFDKAYMEAMVKDHKQVIKEFEEMAEEGKDMEIKNFVTKTLPTLRAHLAQAEQLEELVEDLPAK